MANVRRTEVKKEDGKWTWFLDGVRWEFRISPVRGIWREGVTYASEIQRVPLLCVDDAVIFSKGVERGRAPTLRPTTGDTAA